MDNMIPAQIRAARALVSMSQEELADAAKIGLSTLRDFESMKRGTEPHGIDAIKRVLEQRGVVFHEEREGSGPGVSLAIELPLVVRRPTKLSPYGYLPFAVHWRGRRTIVFVPRTVLDDLDGATGRRTDEQFIASFEKHRDGILRAVRDVLDSETGKSRISPDEKLHLRQDDINLQT